MPKPRPEFIPQTADEVTPEWLTAALQAGGIAKGARVTACQADTPHAGVGFSGMTAMLTIEWDQQRPELPSRLVAKFPTEMAHRGVMEAEGGYEREIWFYEGRIREMPVRVPRRYYSLMDDGPSPKSRRRLNRVLNKTPMPLARVVGRNATKLVRATKRRYVLLIEYIEDARLTPLDQEAPHDDLVVILEHLARIHAEFWGDPTLVDDPTLSYDTASQQFRLLQGGYDVFVDEVLADVEGIQPHHRRAMDWADEHLERVLETLNRPLTMLHGDPRSDNMLFTPDGELVVIDFGVVSSGPPAWDVAYLLSATLEHGADARSKFETYARMYHDALVANGVDAYPLERLLSEMDIVMCFLGHRMVLATAIMEGGYDSRGTGEEVGLGELWMRKVLDLIPEATPRFD